jgi:NitT/TauT family transport system substrate-binding protein/sulfonate transport system substrate-binding protein
MTSRTDLRRPRRWRPLLAGLTGLLALVPALAGCGGSSVAAGSGPGASFPLRVGYISATSKVGGPEGWANSRGTLLAALKPAGVSQVSWAAFPNGPELAAAMRGGSLDLGIFGDTPALVAKAAGLNARLINQSRVNLDTWVFTKKSGGPTSIAGLAGTTVATQTGSYMYRFLLGALTQAGIRDKVKITNIYAPNAAAALLRGDIAAYAEPAQNAPQLAAKGLPVIDKASQDHHDLYGTSVTLATSQVIAAHPGLVAAWNAARAAAVRDVLARTGDYYAYEAGVLNAPVSALPDIEPVSNYSTEPFTPQGLALLTSTARFLYQEKLARSLVDVPAWQSSS